MRRSPCSAGSPDFYRTRAASVLSFITSSSGSPSSRPATIDLALPERHRMPRVGRLEGVVIGAIPPSHLPRLDSALDVVAESRSSKRLVDHPVAAGDFSRFGNQVGAPSAEAHKSAETVSSRKGGWGRHQRPTRRGYFKSPGPEARSVLLGAPEDFARAASPKYLLSKRMALNSRPTSRSATPPHSGPKEDLWISDWFSS